jgi:hypothetical protein
MLESEILSDEISQTTEIIRRILRVEDITTGDPKKSYLVRYRGQLYGDSMAAYDQAVQALRPLSLAPVFREEDGQHIVLIIPAPPAPKPSKPVWNLVMFIITFLSVALTGSLMQNSYGMADASWGYWEYVIGGLPFAFAMLAILLAHEFGHYLMARHHGVNVTLPYFIPLPLISPFGTMGAFIQMKEVPRNKRVLMDVGLAGPVAGMLVAIPVLLLGLWLSQLNVIAPQDLPQGVVYTMEGNSLLYLGAKYLVFGKLLPEPASYGNLPPLIYWVRYFFTGQPFPVGGLDVTIHPIAWAGWGGLLVTALNLTPAGQLDGGHLVYVLIGSRARRLWPLVLAAMVALGFVWAGWWLWVGLIFLFGRIYAEPMDTITPLDSRRRRIAIMGLLLFLIVFIPVPLVQVATP